VESRGGAGGDGGRGGEGVENETTAARTKRPRRRWNEDEDERTAGSREPAAYIGADPLAPVRGWNRC
jgi:hypothetical protein